MKLICFPFAGGTERAFDFLETYLPEGIKLVQLSAPGKGIRFKESHSISFDELIDTYYDQMEFDETYILFGHSMGALIVHCLLHKVISEKQKLPCQVIVSGKEGPSIHKDRKRYHFSNEDVVRLLIRLGGLSKETVKAVDHSTILPFKKDLIILDQWPKRFFRPHMVPVHFIYGSTDKLHPDAAKSWKKTTSGYFSIKVFTGAHFYYLNQKEGFAQELINQILINNKATEGKKGKNFDD
ncbi:thioesterase II family protein [Zobellia galactanivorans]|uniref:Surfactin synthetase thioesterase n=1 Tax=Zobellia galactanivorans (strain DSM 12802 / CCUG 47099 / CIP 106680 / NCIMB 13871 / Dsij) TaxID=63186 RepID=G0L9A4_ZOBGA|nr:thioesterase domain-containing protein [Zobellia galactanivorans]CAZ94456.1 Surfactin synthetase thioesterase [Zobellia galactanivorans]